jgi:5-formyltetrahydrofolate cyclo-ligase
VTEENVFKTERKRAKPRGLLLEFLSRKKIDDTPFLREYLRKTGRLSSF